MALGDPYITRDELKSLLDIPATDTKDNVKADHAVGAASREIDKFCGRQFNLATEASPRVYRPTSRHVADVDDFHTADGLVIEVDHGDTGTFDVTWTAADYQLEPLNGVVDGEIGWPYSQIVAMRGQWFPYHHSGRASVRVTPRAWGWAAIPQTVTQACRILAVETFKLTPDAPFGVAGFGDFGVVRVRDNPIANRMLRPYRRHAVLVG